MLPFPLIHRNSSKRRPERPTHRRAGVGTRPGVEMLEDRCLLSADISVNFNGLAFDPRVPADLPDTILAVGPTTVIEGTNRDLGFYDKTTGNASTDTPLPMQDFFASVLPGGVPVPGDIITDPKVSFNELAGSDGRFIVTMLELNFPQQEAHLLLAASVDADPTGAASDWEMHRIGVSDAANFADFPQVGWDADGVYVTVNMFKWVGHNPFDHSRVLTFETSSLTDGDDSTVTMYSSDRSPPHFAMQPATMFGADPGEPMYFVESQVPGGSSGGGGWINIVQMTDKLSDTPTFTDSKVRVPSYNHPRAADQPGGEQLDTGDARILSAAWRDGRLVATHTVRGGQDAHARWYEFSTTSAQPKLAQVGQLDRGPGVSTFMPSINISPDGDLGLTYLEASATEFLSMYVTGQKAGAVPGTLQTPVLAKAGEGALRHFRAFGELSGPLRTGDYSGVAIDPVDGSFWAGNEFATAALPPPPLGTRQANWGTWIANFTISDGGNAALGTLPNKASASVDRFFADHRNALDSNLLSADIIAALLGLDKPRGRVV